MFYEARNECFDLSIIVTHMCVYVYEIRAGSFFAFKYEFRGDNLGDNPCLW